MAKKEATETRRQQIYILSLVSFVIYYAFYAIETWMILGGKRTPYPWSAKRMGDFRIGNMLKISIEEIESIAIVRLSCVSVEIVTQIRYRLSFLFFFFLVDIDDGHTRKRAPIYICVLNHKF